MSTCSLSGAITAAPAVRLQLPLLLLLLMLLLLLQSARPLSVSAANECPELAGRFPNFVSPRPRYFFASVSDAQPLPVSVCTAADPAGSFAGRIFAALLTSFFRYSGVKILSSRTLDATSCTFDLGLLQQSDQLFNVTASSNRAYFGELFQQSFKYTASAATCDPACGSWMKAGSLADIPDSASRYCGLAVASKRLKSMLPELCGQDPRLERLLLALSFNFTQLASGGIACDWLGRAMDAWAAGSSDGCQFCSHLPDITDRKDLYLAGMFPAGKRFSNERITTKVMDVLDDLNRGVCNGSAAGQPKCFLARSGYRIVLEPGNVDCDKSAELGFYIKTLLQPRKQPLLGVIGATCSDTIEPVVEASNNFRTVIISPTVESQVYSDTARYPYFYRTIPSYEPYADTITHYLTQRKWDTIGLLVRNKMFLNKTAFLESGTINVCHEEVIEEERLSYRQALKNLKSTLPPSTLPLHPLYPHAIPMAGCERTQAADSKSTVWPLAA